MKAAGFVSAFVLAVAVVAAQALAAAAHAEDSRIRCYNRKFSSGSEAAILCIYPLAADDESDSRQDNDLYDFGSRHADDHMPESSWLSSPSPPPLLAWRRTLRNKGPSTAGGGQPSSFLNVNFPNSGRLLPRLY